MLLIKSFNNKGNYISPEDELTIYNDVTALFVFWRDIIVKNSSKKSFELNSNEMEQLHNFIQQVQGFELNKSQSIGLQLDRLVVEILVWGSVIANNEKVLDEVYLKTKNSMFNYFHHDLLVRGYLKLSAEEKAISIISLLFNKDHIAYLFVLKKYNEEKYKEHPKFYQKLKEYKSLINVKALSRGEKIDLKNVSYDELLEIVNKVKNFLK